MNRFSGIQERIKPSQSKREAAKELPRFPGGNGLKPLDEIKGIIREAVREEIRQTVKEIVRQEIADALRGSESQHIDNAGLVDSEEKRQEKREKEHKEWLREMEQKKEEEKINPTIHARKAAKMLGVSS